MMQVFSRSQIIDVFDPIVRIYVYLKAKKNTVVFVHKVIQILAVSLGSGGQRRTGLEHRLQLLLRFLALVREEFGWEVALVTGVAPEHTSSEIPSSASHLTTCEERKALAA